MPIIEEVGPPTIYTPGFGNFPAKKMTLMSVHYEMKSQKFFHSRRRPFVLMPASRSNPTYCNVYDSQQLCPDTASLHTYTSSEPYPQPIPMPVKVEFIAEDLLRLWCRSSLGAQSRNSAGIILIKGETGTAEEIDRANKMEEKLCAALVQEADEIEKTGKGKIAEIHRGALEWLGSENRSWYRVIEPGTTKISPISGKRIPMDALGDGGLDLMEFYVRNGLEPDDYGDVTVVNLWKNKPEIKKMIQARCGISASVIQTKGSVTPNMNPGA